jgi:hypothetical protein
MIVDLDGECISLRVMLHHHLTLHWSGFVPDVARLIAECPHKTELAGLVIATSPTGQQPVDSAGGSNTEQSSDQSQYPSST